MSITLQGSWTVSVKSKDATYPQRFVISGSDSADGTYDGIVGSPSVHVSGSQWTLTVQHNPTGPISWSPSAERLGTPYLAGDQLKFDIRSNDAGGDADYNDLVLTCTMQRNDVEYVLYGRVRTYSGLCRFNPCFPYPWLVIESAASLVDLLRYPPVRAVLEELYPQRIYELEHPPLVRKPFPDPDPVPFRPMMIPLSTPLDQPQVVFRSAQPAGAAMRAPAAGAKAQIASMQAKQATAVSSVSAQVNELARIKDRFAAVCTVQDRPGVLLRFVEYDRTTAELAGGPYEGTGVRRDLGLTVTDELGNYIFRFTQTLTDIVEETGDVPSGASLATELRPDILVQLVSGMGPTTAVLFETGLYANVTNVKRIDLCIPESAVNPGPACQGGRAIQSVGNIFTLAGVGNTLDADGRITATHPSGPQITKGAWVGTLDMFACFLDHPEVSHYTVRYRKPGGGWAFVSQGYTHIYIPAIGDPASPLHKVGPFDTALPVDGGPAQTVPAYKNIESDANWVVTHRIRKIQLASALYAGTLYTDTATGSVDFRIEGYKPDPAHPGDYLKVAAADDTIRLYIDNRSISGSIASISMGGVAPGECGLFELPAPNTALAVRFRVDQPGGFVTNYHLSVLRGSATPVAVSDTTPPAQPLDVSYSDAAFGSTFSGTADGGVAPDGTGYVVAELQPSGGSWLPAGKSFCAFAFEIHGTPRQTNGYGLAPGYRLDVELVGISHSS